MKNISILAISLRKAGTERVISILMNNLYKEFNLKLVLLEDDIEYELNNDIRPHVLKGKYVWEKLNDYISFLRKENIEISISFLTLPNLINMLVKQKLKKLKIVLNERSNPFKTYNSFRKLPIKYFVLPYIYSKRADLIITNSHKTAFDLSRKFGLENNLKVIYNPVDIDFINLHCNEEISRFKYLFNNKKIVKIVSMGRLEKVKRFDVLIKAFNKANIKNSVLIIIGDGPERANLYKLVEKEKIEEKVFFLGKIDNPFKYLKFSDIFILSSEREGCPNALLEAMACGLPVVSTDCISGPRGILSSFGDLNYGSISPGSFVEMNFGILVPVNDVNALSKAIVYLVENHDVRRKYGRLSKERVHDFSLKKFLYQYRKVIKNL